MPVTPSVFPAEAISLLAVAVGGYVSIGKTVPVVLVLLLWARVLTWADKDAVAAHLPRTALNISNLCGMDCVA